MKRVLHRLHVKTLDAIAAPAFEPDGGGLYFQHTKAGSRSWIYRFNLNGKTRDMGLGPFPATSLGEARELRDDARKLVRDGVDPILAREQGRQVAAASLTFEQAAQRWHTAQRPRWKTKKHTNHVARRLQQHVYPVIGALPVATIGNAEIRQALAPIWFKKPSLGERMRADLWEVIEWATHEGHRDEDRSNPAELQRLKFSLPTGLHKVEHHAALSWSEAPAFLARLRHEESMAAKALRFILLCGVRVSDVTGAHKAHSVPALWSHIDLQEKVWRIPDTKSGKPHAVPLSDAAIAVLDEVRRYRDPRTDFVFPGARKGTRVRDTSLRRLLQEMGYGGRTTVHGCRSMLRTWASECTAYSKDIVEMALAHSQSALDAAYMRGDLLDKRRRLMRDWADYLDGRAVPQGAEVVALRA